MIAAPDPNEPRPEARRHLPAAGEAVRVLLGLLLLAASVLKGWQLATEPTPERDLLTSRWFLIAGVEMEFLLALWLLNGLYRHAARRAALGCFGLFTCITLYKALAGEASCGCFGRVQINPWYTLLLDLGIVGLLVISPVRQAPTLARHPRRLPRWSLAALPLGGAVAALGAAGMAGDRHGQGGQDGMVIGDSGYIILEPEKWVGKPFGLLPYVDVHARLAQGAWVAVLYHYDCPECQRVVPRLERLAALEAARSGFVRVALLELPPYGPPQTGHETPLVRGRLADSHSYFVETPVAAVLSDGRVEAIFPAASISEVEDMLIRGTGSSAASPVSDEHVQLAQHPAGSECASLAR